MDRAPDFIEPFSAYRMWTLGAAALLHPMTVSIGGTWHPGLNNAVCFCNPEYDMWSRRWDDCPDRVDEFGIHSCGFYACKSIYSLRLGVSNLSSDSFRDDPLALGTVDLSGTIAECSLGYRATEATITALKIFFPRSWMKPRIDSFLSWTRIRFSVPVSYDSQPSPCICCNAPMRICQYIMDHSSHTHAAASDPAKFVSWIRSLQRSSHHV